MRARRWLPSAVLLSAVVSCIDLTVDPTQIGSIEFVAPTMPSMIVGDTLRDSSGVAESLVAKVFTTDGKEVAGSPASFVATDSIVLIVAGNRVVSSRGLAGKATGGVTGTAKLFASIGSLQSAVRLLEIINRPDSLAANSALQDTILYFEPRTGTLDDSLTSVSVLVRDTTGAPARAVLVSFRILRNSVPLVATDTGTYALLNDNSRPSRIDTTDAGGVASRRVRFRARAGTVTRDTIKVQASVSVARKALKNSPVSFTLLVLPKPTM